MRSSAPDGMGLVRRFSIAVFLKAQLKDWMHMTKSQNINTYQVKPLDDNAPATPNPTQRSDPRVAAFLDRLREKAEAIEAAQREKHVTAKVPRRRPTADQAANPDWYQPATEKTSTPSVSAVKRFATKPKGKAKAS